MLTIREFMARHGRSPLRLGYAYLAIEVVLLLLFGALLIRLFWLMAMPLDRADVASGPGGGTSAAATTLGNFDPFFHLAPGEASGVAPKSVTSLQLTLFGTRIDAATGRGGAIIASSDGVQKNFAVGDEVEPGAVLKAVGFDYVVLAHGGSEESLFLDQSRGGSAVAAIAPPAPGASPAPAPGAPAIPAPAGEATITVANLRTGLGFIPRVDAGKVTGLFVRAQGASGVFSKVGFKYGDVVVQIGGRAVRGPGDFDALANAFPRGGTLSLTLERGGEVLPLVITVSA